MKISIRSEVVEAAAREMWASGPTTARPAYGNLSDSQKEFAQHEARAAIAAFCEAEGLTVEHRPPGPDLYDYPVHRLVGPWRAEETER